MCVSKYDCVPVPFCSDATGTGPSPTQPADCRRASSQFIPSISIPTSAVIMIVLQQSITRTHVHVHVCIYRLPVLHCMCIVSEFVCVSVTKVYRVHLSPGSSSGLVTYTLRILAKWYTFFMGHTAIFLLVGIKA